MRLSRYDRVIRFTKHSVLQSHCESFSIEINSTSLALIWCIFCCAGRHITTGDMLACSRPSLPLYTASPQRANAQMASLTFDFISDPTVLHCNYSGSSGGGDGPETRKLQGMELIWGVVISAFLTVARPQGVYMRPLETLFHSLLPLDEFMIANKCASRFPASSNVIGRFMQSRQHMRASR